MPRPLPTQPSHRLPLLLLVLFGTVIAGLALIFGPLAVPSPSAPELKPLDVQANVFTPSAQEQVVVGAMPDGGTVVAWASRRQERGSYGVYARAFDTTGRPRTNEIHVNVTERGQQHLPAVAVDRNGVWFAWESIGQDGSGAGVVARRFDLDLVAASGEIAVNVETEGDQGAPVIAAGEEGLALVAWSAQGGTRGGVRGRWLDPRTGPNAAPFVISDGRTDATPAISALPDGAFVVAWSRASGSQTFELDGAGPASALSPESDSSPRRRFEVVARRLAADEPDRKREVRLSRGPAIEPAITVDGAGRWIVAWLRLGDGVHEVVQRRFDPQGVPLGPPQTVARDHDAWLADASVAARHDGRFAVLFTREGHAGTPRIWARYYAANGEAMGPAARVRIDSVADRKLYGGERARATSGASRSVWTTSDAFAIAWQGASERDSNAANLTLLLPSAAARTSSATAKESGVETAAAPRTRSEDFLAARPPIWDPAFVRPERLPAGQQIGGDFGFEAVPGTGWTPPDPEMAVGPEQIVVMTNGEITAFDKLGNEQWSDKIENSDGFWGELGADNFVFDPEATWDPHALRFIVMANERSDASRSYFLLAISKDERPDDRDDWHKYRIDVTDAASPGIDSPNLGLSRDYILLTADFFGPDRYLFVVLDKSSVLEGGPPVFNFELFTGGQSMGVPVVYSDTGTLYAMQAGENFFGENTEITLHAITDPIDDYSRVTFDLTVPPYVTSPADPPQLGSGSRPELFESRFWSVAEGNGTIWAVHHVGSDRARVRWYRIELNGWPGVGTPTLADGGELDLGGSIATFFPSIHVDDADNVAITFARSAPNEYFSIGRVLRAAGDAAGTFRPAQIVQTSQIFHNSGRWGDYSSTQADPNVPGTFWGHHEFTNGSPSSWRTWVGRYDLRAEPMLLSVDPIVAGQTATFDVTGATPNGEVYLVFGFAGTGITEIPALDVAISIEGPVRFLQTIADAIGNATFSAAVPSAASGREVTLQAVEANRTTNWEVEVVQ